MKLYSLDASPFASRVRIQVYAKDIALEILPPPGGLGSDEFRALTPLGKIPALALGDTVIVESAVIREYLEEKFPQPSLPGTTPEQTAAIRTLCLLTDLHLVPRLLRLRAHIKGEVDGSDSLSDSVAALKASLTDFDHNMGEGSLAVGDSLTLADCALAPVYFYINFFASALKVDIELERLPSISAWSQKVEKETAVKRVFGEIGNALPSR